MGDTGTFSRTFSDGGDTMCQVPPLFSLRVCVWRGFKTKCDVCHVLCDEFFMLDVTHCLVDVETEFGVVSLILTFLYIFTSKKIVSILQVSRFAQDCLQPLSDIYLVWFTVRNVTVLKQ